MSGKRARVKEEWARRAALGVVVAAPGYPDAPKKGDVVTGLPATGEDFRVFHSGTALKDGAIVTSGGRVLCVTAMGDSIKAAQRRAYEGVEGIRFDGMQYRRAIGHRPAAAPKSWPVN